MYKYNQEKVNTMWWLSRRAKVVNRIVKPSTFFACSRIQKSTPPKEDPADSGWNLSDLAFQTVKDFSSPTRGFLYLSRTPKWVLIWILTHHLVLFLHPFRLLLLLLPVVPRRYSWSIADQNGCYHRVAISRLGCWWQSYWQKADWEAPQNLFLSRWSSLTGQFDRMNKLWLWSCSIFFNLIGSYAFAHILDGWQWLQSILEVRLWSSWVWRRSPEMQTLPLSLQTIIIRCASEKSLPRI